VSINAIVEGNSIKLPPGTNLPDGTKVCIVFPTNKTGSEDLTSLIGSWQEDADFDAAIQAFEQVDKSLWR